MTTSAYQALARKWRPKTFADLVGQEHIVQALQNALAKGRLHHAYLLTGTRGVGKTTIARILAKAFNCSAPQQGEPCGQCPSCLAIDQNRFPDLLEIDAASNTGIDNIREVLENAQYAPTSGQYKVYIIDEVHMLSKSAFNAMLKTLEEPPPHVKFILATTDPQKVPVTVLSRCLQFVLHNMTPQQVAAHLAHVLDCEHTPYETPALNLLARAAAGSMRDALSLLDQAIAMGAGTVREQDVRQMTGSIDRKQLYALLDALAEQDGGELITLAKAMGAYVVGFEPVLAELALLLQELALVRHVPSALDDNPEQAELLRLAARFHPEQIQLYYQCVLHGRQDLPLAPDEYAGWLMTLLRMLAFAPFAAADTPVDGHIEGTAYRSAPPAPVHVAPSADTVPRKQFRPQDLPPPRPQEIRRVPHTSGKPAPQPPATADDSPPWDEDEAPAPQPDDRVFRDDESPEMPVMQRDDVPFAECTPPYPDDSGDVPPCDVVFRDDESPETSAMQCDDAPFDEDTQPCSDDGGDVLPCDTVFRDGELPEMPVMQHDDVPFEECAPLCSDNDSDVQSCDMVFRDDESPKMPAMQHNDAPFDECTPPCSDNDGDLLPSDAVFHDGESPETSAMQRDDVPFGEDTQPCSDNGGDTLPCDMVFRDDESPEIPTIQRDNTPFEKCTPPCSDNDGDLLTSDAVFYDSKSPETSAMQRDNAPFDECASPCFNDDGDVQSCDTLFHNNESPKIPVMQHDNAPFAEYAPLDHHDDDAPVGELQDVTDTTPPKPAPPLERAAWFDIAAHIGRQVAAGQMLLQHLAWVSLAQHTLTLAAMPEKTKNTNNKEYFERIVHALQQVYGADLDVKLTEWRDGEGWETPSMYRERILAEQRETARQLLEKDAAVRVIMRTFSARWRTESLCLHD